MKAFLSLILFLFVSLVGFAQQDYPDSGFTNKAEAKNLMVKGLKEGKWLEYYFNQNNKSDTLGYLLTFYRRGLPFGMRRAYYMNGKIWIERAYINEYCKENGVEKYYYKNGQIQYETPYKDGFENGVGKEYYENGKIKCETTYLKGIRESSQSYDEKGNVIILYPK